MVLSENILTLLNIIITALIAILTSFITSRYTTKPEKQKTSRLIFENCYSKIYSLVEFDLFSKDISLFKVRDYGEKIVEICNNSNNYYFPSVKIYAERLEKSTKDDYQENWEYFSQRFSFRYDSVCKNIGLPLRNSAYRINRNHYKNNRNLIYFALKNDWGSVISLIILFALMIFLFKINS